MKIVTMDIQDLMPYDKNAKRHPDFQVAQIKKSIEQFGMNDPIAVSGPDNIIVEGHGRYLACLELGMTEVPVIRLDDLSEEQRRAYALVHNKVAMETGFDFEKLQKEIASIQTDLSDFGLTSDLEDIKYDDMHALFDHEDTNDDNNDEEKPMRFCTCPYCGEKVPR